MSTPIATPTPAPAAIEPTTGGLTDYMEAKFREAGLTEDAPPSETPAPSGDPEKKEPTKPKADATVAPVVEDFTSLEDPEEVEEIEDETPLDEEEGLEDEEDDDVPEAVKKQGEKAITTWGELKKAKSEAVKQVKDLAAKVKDLEGKLQKSGAGDTDAELTTLRERVAEQERIIAATNVVESTEYREAVTIPLDNYGKTVHELVDDPAVALKIFDAFAAGTTKERLELLSEATEGMSELMRHEIYDISKKVSEIWAKEKHIKEKAVEAKAEIDKNALARTVKETEAEKTTRLAAADKIWKNTQAKIPAMFGDDGELRPEFAEIGTQGREASITEAALGTQVFAGFAVKLVPLLSKEITAREEQVAARDKEISDLKTQINRLTGSSTKVKQGSVSTSVPAGGGKPVRAIEAIDGKFRENGYG